MKEGFAFSGSGTFRRTETFVGKSGKPMYTAIVEIKGQYPQSIPIKAFGRLADRLSELRPGDIIEVTGRLGGRDWNGKVYGDIVAETIEVIAAGHPTDDTPPPPADDDVPF